MNEFITKLAFNVNISSMLMDLADVLDHHKWDDHNQIGLRHRKNAVNEWIDSRGDLLDRKTNTLLAKESDFTEWNSKVPSYTKWALDELAESQGIRWGRIRYMRLMSKTGLSVHNDNSHRYHLALITNKNSYFAECLGDEEHRCVGFNIPSNGYWYKVDTTKKHFVFNGSWEPRIHLVCCPINMNYENI